MSFTVTGSPLAALRLMRDAQRFAPGAPRQVVITATIPPNALPTISGDVTGNLFSVGSLLTIVPIDFPRPSSVLVEDIRPEWVTSVEII